MALGGLAFSYERGTPVPLVKGPGQWLALQELLYTIQKSAFAVGNNEDLKLHCSLHKATVLAVQR